VRTASEAMGRVARAAYRPDPRAAEVYDRLYAEYRMLHDHFGRGGNDVMKRLRRLRLEANA
jgi:L-ribulokinase